MSRITAAGALLCALALSSCQPAFTQAAVQPAPTLWNDLFQPLILTAASTIITAAIGIGATHFARWTGIEIEAKQREALHSAAMTGVNLALAKYGPAVGLARGGQAQVVSDAMTWVLSTGAPRAVARPKLSDDDVRKLVESKLGAMVNASATVAVTTGISPAGR